MARVKEYNRDDVLAKAVHVFWAKGYEATSMSDLVSATGLNTFSMYKEFGNKEGLFEASLDSFYNNQLVPLQQPLRNNPGLDSIKQYLENMRAMADDSSKGCFFCNTLTDTEVVSAAAIRKIEEYYCTLSSLLENCILAAQGQGDIPQHKNPQKLANYIMCFMYGVSLFGRLHGFKSQISDMVDDIVDTIRQ